MFKKLFTKAVAAIGSALGFFSVAHAEVPTNVSTAITTAGTDAATMGGLVLVAIIGIYAIKFLRRAL